MTTEQLHRAAKEWKIRHEAVCSAWAIVNLLPGMQEEAGKLAQAQQCAAVGEFSLVKSIAEFIDAAIGDFIDNHTDPPPRKRCDTTIIHGEPMYHCPHCGWTGREDDVLIVRENETGMAHDVCPACKAAEVEEVEQEEEIEYATR